MRSLLPVLAIYCVTVVGFFLLYVKFSNQLPSSYKTWTALALFVFVFLLAQVPMMYFRRNVRRLSTERGLICPSCSTALGFSYATLKRTGKCRACGAQVVGAT